MKINVVKDATGKVIATFEKAVGDGPSVAPVLVAGHTLDEMEVAENYRESISAFYKQNSR
jgi:hypothetical protein